MSPGGVADVLTRHCHAGHDDTLLALEINFKENSRPTHFSQVPSDRLCILAPSLYKLTNGITVYEFAAGGLGGTSVAMETVYYSK